MSDALEKTGMMADTGMLVLIWLVQCIIYPAFRAIEADRFEAWHRRYMQTISVFVIPLMLIQLTCSAWAAIAHPVPWNVISMAAVAAAWAVTFCISAPCHQKLQRIGKDPATIERIIRTNWLRTLAWTIAWMAGWAP